MKRIVICCDGTWNRADQEKNGVPCPTNVVKLASRVAKGTDAERQIIYYDQGVGTGNVVDRFTGGAFGHGLGENILSAYRFLVANYELGDEIFLFGFSRGAFTARSLAGMIRNCGILKRIAIKHYREAVQLYMNRGDPPYDSRSVEFRKEHALGGGTDIPIKFIGVWDTVGSLGIPLRGLRSLTIRKYQFHDTELSRTVENAYHALAIDEFRAPFEPTLWKSTKKEGQEIKQVWFVGAHSDVGGGYDEPGLSDIALDWMLQMAENCGLVLDPDVLIHYPLDKMGATDPKRFRILPHNSKSGLYRITRGIDRSIGVEHDHTGVPTGQLDPTQDLHDTVRQRWDADPAYRPRPLRRYFQLIGDPRATA